MSDSPLPHLNPAEARVLGCLAEKQRLTPDAYPLTFNALQAAANQKSSRKPVMALEPADIQRALQSLEKQSLVRRAFGSRAERFEQAAAATFVLTVPQSALLALLLLRGPQTINELLTRSERMANLGSADDVRQELDMLISRHPALVKEIGRAPGQREDRFAHLLSGDVDVADIPSTSITRDAAPSRMAELEQRVQTLEEEVAALKARLDSVGA
jgi:uncharacterized protein YceH (UPF0502 family)